jgi:anthranilate synthase/aminodeoxychorismate synthase-like glutamine amidotransferase
VVFIDNFDSFTFNLVDEFARRGATVEVWRNTVSVSHALARANAVAGPRLVVLSPGPGGPREAGCCLDLIRQAGPGVPVFGVCLGHQAIIEAWNGVVEPASAILHGRSSRVSHTGDALFAGVPSPVTVGRYHSLASHGVPAALQALAWTDRIVMAVRHRTLPQIGIQFHPESILTPYGGPMIENVIRWAGGEA